MSMIFLPLVVLPLLMFVILAFIFTSQVKEITQHQTIMNCPFPINSGIANLTAVQTPPTINYTQTFDNDASDYHVTVFECEFDPASEGASIFTRVYTADINNSWFDITNRASGYAFYIGEVFDTIGIRLNAFGHVVYLLFVAPAVVTGMAWFAYVNVFLAFLIASGIGLAIRGG